MALKDNLFTKNEARAKLMSGIQKVAEAVGGTMGTGGSNAIIEAIESPGHLLTNDGWTILDSIQFADPIEDMGRKILREAVLRSNKASGDGSSTACVLTAAIIKEGIKYTDDTNAMTIKRSLEACLPDIEDSIDFQARTLTNEFGAVDLLVLQQVATISSEDEAIGKRIAEIYGLIGKTGIIHWDISKTAEDYHTIGSGITINGAGWFSPYMCDATENGQSLNQVRIANPYILVMKQKLTSAADIGDLAAALNAKEVKDLVIFCDDIDPLVVPDIIKTRMVRGFRIAVVKMPVLWKDQWFEDLARTTGAKVVDPVAGLTLKAATLDHLGRCANIVITKEDSYLDGIKDVSEHVNALEVEATDDSKLRASRLNTKTARYFVGAPSDSALSYRRLKVEDAIAAAWQALNGGVVSGGGVALMNATVALKGDTVGEKILRAALMYPIETITGNAGINQEWLPSATETTMGFDTRTGKAVDMFEAGILDPANIVLTAVRNAISVAAAILTANTVVTLPRDDAPQQPQPPYVPVQR